MQGDWPIFVLTLQGDEERRAALLAALGAAGLGHRLILGVDGRRGLPADCLSRIDREAAHRRMGRAMSDAEFACALSHRRIYETIEAEELAGAIVLEDDAILRPDFADFVAAGLHRVETMALLDYRFGRAVPWQRRTCGRWILYRAAQRATLTSAYSVSRRTAQALLRATDPVSFVADWPADLHDLGAWLVTPRVVHHNPPGQGPSHLEQARAGMAPRAKSAARYGDPAYWRGLLRRKLARKVGR